MVTAPTLRSTELGLQVYLAQADLNTPARLLFMSSYYPPVEREQETADRYLSGAQVF